MKRRLRMIVLFLLLLGGGAIVNVAVAWSLAIWVNFNGAATVQLTGLKAERAYSSFHLDDPFHLGAKPFVSRADGEPAVDEARRFRQRALSVRGPGQYELSSVLQCGLPMRALACGVRRDIRNPNQVARLDALKIPEWKVFSPRPYDCRALPFRPIWSGFAINTVFYAAILWLLFAAPFALRRRWRIKRGLCVQCGYDLRGSPHPSPLPPPKGEGVLVCPECGAVVRPMVGRAAIQ